jgi:hypothetical protein
MEPLPMAPDSCSLSEPELESQLARYREIGHGARVESATDRRLELVVDPSVHDGLIEATIATETACCPFFGLEWTAAERRFVVTVAKAEREPALAQIARALGAQGTSENSSADSPSHPYR